MGATLALLLADRPPTLGLACDEVEDRFRDVTGRRPVIEAHHGADPIAFPGPVRAQLGDLLG
jgi:hypothetical protein